MKISTIDFLIKEQTEHMIATSIEQIPNIPCFDDSPRGRLLHGAAYLFHKQGYDKTTVRELAQFIESNREAYFIISKVKMISSLM